MPQLDGLRALAVVAVIFSHYAGFAYRLTLGDLGVRLFFVLSGFLITGILLQSRGRPTSTALKVFYARRVLRIFPIYYLTLFLAVLFGVPTVREAIGWHVLYLSNYYLISLGLGAAGNPLLHFWSLAVEEQFYLLWPLIILRTPGRYLPWVIAGTILLGPFSRWGLFALTRNAATTSALICCVDTLGIGALLAWWWSTGHARISLAIPFVGVTLLGAAHAISALWFLRDLGAALVFVAVVDRAARGFSGPVGFFLSCRPVVALGAVSYGMYVYHFLVSRLGLPGFPSFDDALRFGYGEGVFRFAYATVASIVIATASWWLVERPVQRLKRYVPYVAVALAQVPLSARPQALTQASVEVGQAIDV
jgi:peptidoglycan/LPS O-acetylase OafA/YrhL